MAKPKAPKKKETKPNEVSGNTICMGKEHDLEWQRNELSSYAEYIVSLYYLDKKNTITKIIINNGWTD
jgi:hypothetical protein